MCIYVLNTFTKPTTWVFSEDDIWPRNTCLIQRSTRILSTWKKIVATKSLQMVAAVICNQVHLCRSQVDFLNYQYVNVEQNVIFQFRFTDWILSKWKKLRVRCVRIKVSGQLWQLHNASHLKESIDVAFFIDSFLQPQFLSWNGWVHWHYVPKDSSVVL